MYLRFCAEGVSPNWRSSSRRKAAQSGLGREGPGNRGGEGDEEDDDDIGRTVGERCREIRGDGGGEF